MTLERVSRRIEHSEGRFIVDTGDTSRNSVPGYLPRWNPFFTKEVHIKVAPYEEIGARLHDMQIDPQRDIRVVILPHLHHDHTGGLDLGCAKTKSDLVVMPSRRQIFAFSCSPHDHTFPPYPDHCAACVLGCLLLHGLQKAGASS